MYLRITLLFFVFAIFAGCQQPQIIDQTKIKKGMIKVAIFYPDGVGKSFDMDYYATKHMPMAADLFGDALKAWSIDKGIANAAPDQPLQYIAIGYFFFETMEAFQGAMAANQEKIVADVANYTNIQPAVQISEVQIVE